MPELTPLDHVPGFTEPIRTALRPYWITSAEEFASLARLGNPEHTTAMNALAIAMRIDRTTIDTLYKACLEASPQRAREYSASTELIVGDGLLLDESDAPSGALSFALPAGLPESHTLPIAHLPPVLQQGERNTCVAFTMVAMYQIVSQDATDLSEQFLFWACKQVDKRPNDPSGTTPQAAIDALRHYGVCLETDWPYEPGARAGDITRGQPSRESIAAATRRKVGGGGKLESTSSAAVITALAEGLPVLLGLDYYPFWTQSGQALRGGRVRLPLPGETRRGGHAVCAIGYQKDESAPGGGYIIFRNSWGEDFGAENAYACGYGYVPYEVVDATNRFAYTIDQVIAPTSLGAPGASEQANTGDLIAEARAVFTRAQGEMNQLRALLDRLARGER